MRSDASTGILQQPSTLGYFRDYFFLLYQTNAIFGIGLLAGPIVLYLLYQGWRLLCGMGNPTQWLLLEKK